MVEMRQFWNKYVLHNGMAWLAAALVVIGAAVYLPAALMTSGQAAGRKIPIYSVETEKKQVALSFDAAWGNEDTSKILDILEKHQIHSTFFMTGGWVEKYPEDVQRIAQAGHDLGNHSQNHKEMSRLDSGQARDEIMKVHESVKELTGKSMELFRPPYGDYDDELISTAENCGYLPIQWSVDSLDWKNYGVEDIVNRVLNHKELRSGAIILMHNGAKYTAQALEALISGLEEKGYEIVPVSRLIYQENYQIDQEGRQFPG
ncbi:polysaccharide deacetylase family protein [Cuneatibacter caecimuris]